MLAREKKTAAATTTKKENDDGKSCLLLVAVHRHCCVRRRTNCCGTVLLFDYTRIHACSNVPTGGEAYDDDATAVKLKLNIYIGSTS
jgi:hypothetical protein